jgi:hypothetical protein
MFLGHLGGDLSVLSQKTHAPCSSGVIYLPLKKREKIFVLYFGCPAGLHHLSAQSPDYGVYIIIVIVPLQYGNLVCDILGKSKGCAIKQTLSH